MPPFGVGLRLLGVLELDALPASILDALERAGADRSIHRQLLVVVHVGKEIFRALTPDDLRRDDPIDDFAVRTTEAHFAAHFPGRRHRLLYPRGAAMLPLQSIGALLGVRHVSPFMVGIDARFGTWFAYRAVIAADTELPATVVEDAPSPCSSCATRPCVTSCPAGAITEHGFELARCAAHRLGAGSSCAESCLARVACPVGEEHRYDEVQLRYHYKRSLHILHAMSARKT